MYERAPSPSVKKKLSAMGRATLALDKTESTELLKESEWLARYRNAGGERLPTTDEAIIFYDMTVLARLERSSIKRRLYAQTGLAIHDAMVEAKDFGLLLESKTFGLSLDTIFDQKQKLAQQCPADVYGHMVLWSTPPTEQQLYDAVPYNFIPVTFYSSEELKLISKNSRFPVHTHSLLQELSGLFQKATHQVRSDLFDPNAPRHKEAVEVYEQIAARGTPFQVSLLFSQMLGTGTPDQGRQAYSTLRKLTEETDYAFYEECLATIEDSFDGLLGEEFYEYLQIQRQEDDRIDDEAFDALHQKKQQLLKQVKDSQAALSLPDGTYGSLPILDPELVYHKNGTRTIVALFGNIQTTADEPIPLSLQLGDKKSYSWNLLRDNTELPEVFNHVVLAADKLFDQALLQLTPESTTQPSVRTAPKPYAIPTQPSRPLSTERKRQKSASIDSESNTSASVAIDRRFVNTILDVDFPDEIAQSLDRELLTEALVAIKKYSEGYKNSRQLHTLSPNGRKAFRFRKGKVRVLVELNERGSFTVYQVGYRKSVYS